MCILEEMNDEQAGKFIKAIVKYKTSGKLPKLDFGLKMAISPFIKQFERDKKKYEAVCEKNKEIANNRWNKESTKSTSGTSGVPKSTKSTTRTSGVPKSTKSTYNDNDNDNDNDIKKTKAKKDFFEFEFGIAKELSKIIEKKKKIATSKSKWEKWQKPINDLLVKDLKHRENPKDDIAKALKAIEEHSENKYFPTVESGNSFRNKFLGIEGFLQRQTPTTSKLSTSDAEARDKRLKAVVAKAKERRKKQEENNPPPTQNPP